MHSARWDDSVDFAGKRVAVIGTGASAIQIVPELAKVAGHLDVYQRTAPWIVPRTERPYTPVEHWAFTHIPAVQTASRAGIYTFNEFIAFGMTYSPKALKPVEMLARANIFRGIRDPQLRKAVTPEFQIGCKRILRSNTWYPALDRANVDLVTDPITRVTETGIVTADGAAHDIDILVVATGFHVTDSPVFSHIVGVGGRSLANVWDEIGMQGTSSFVHGFPNMMLMIGPSTGLGHTSMVYMIESQLNYLVDYIATVRARGATRVEVTEAAQRRYNAGIAHKLRNSVWVNGGCASWYKDVHGNITTLWPGFTFDFRRETRKFDVAAYDISHAASTVPAQLTSAPTAGVGAEHSHHTKEGTHEDFRDKVVVVTGAGSGMGRDLAVKLSRLGAKLAISDVNPDGLAVTERLITEPAAKCTRRSSTSPSARPSSTMPRPSSPITAGSTSSSTMPGSLTTARSNAPSSRTSSASSTSTSGEWSTAPRLSCRTSSPPATVTSSTPRRCSASSPSPARPPTTLRSSPSGDSPKRSIRR